MTKHHQHYCSSASRPGVIGHMLAFAHVFEASPHAAMLAFVRQWYHAQQLGRPPPAHRPVCVLPEFPPRHLRQLTAAFWEPGLCAFCEASLNLWGLTLFEASLHAGLETTERNSERSRYWRGLGVAVVIGMLWAGHDPSASASLLPCFSARAQGSLDTGRFVRVEASPHAVLVL